MANFHIYFSFCWLLLTWYCGIIVASPMRTTIARQRGQCATKFKQLRLNVSGLLKHDVLWHEIQSDRILPTTSSDTVLACAPALNKTMCHKQRLGSFNESDCLKNIEKDLYHYEAIIRSYTSRNLRNPDEEVPPLTETLNIISNLLQACRFTSMSKASDEVVAQMWGDSSYENRLKMLMMMKAFYVRTITFNRAVGYIESGEHRSLGPSSDLLQ